MSEDMGADVSSGGGSLHELKGWLLENDPDLWCQIGHMRLFDGAKMICDKYNLEYPHGADAVEAGSKRILEELRNAKQQD